MNWDAEKRMAKDVRDNPELYAALADTDEGDEAFGIGTLSVDNDPDANHYHKIGPVLKETPRLDIHDAMEQ